MSSPAHEGALFLDEKHPGWENEIDVDRLNMFSDVSCVLGQLHGGYWIGLHQLGINPHTNTELFRLGFNASAHKVSPASTLRGLYSLLTKAWKQQIAVRRAQAA